MWCPSFLHCLTFSCPYNVPVSRFPKLLPLKQWTTNTKKSGPKFLVMTMKFLYTILKALGVQTRS